MRQPRRRRLPRRSRGSTERSRPAQSAGRQKETEPLAAGAAAEGLAKRTYEVVAAGKHAFAATTAGLTVYDISSPAKPEIVTSLYFPGSANGVP